jgi:hypothetical protein
VRFFRRKNLKAGGFLKSSAEPAKNRLLAAYSPEIAPLFARKTLTLGPSRLGCAANAPPMGGRPIPDIQRF